MHAVIGKVYLSEFIEVSYSFGFWLFLPVKGTCTWLMVIKQAGLCAKELAGGKHSTPALGVTKKIVVRVDLMMENDEKLH